MHVTYDNPETFGENMYAIWHYFVEPFGAVVLGYFLLVFIWWSLVKFRKGWKERSRKNLPRSTDELTRRYNW